MSASTSQPTRPPLASISDRISRFGERHQIDALIYNPGLMWVYGRYASENAPGFAQRLVATFGPVRYLDVGAGTGQYAAALRKLGVTVDACEHSRWGRMFGRLRGVTVGPFDLERNDGPSASGYDVAFCLEVAEHLPIELGDRLVDYLAEFPTVVFTAAHPGQGGHGHVNEQPQPYWDARFEAHDHHRRADLEDRFRSAVGRLQAPWLTENLMIYQH